MAEHEGDPTTPPTGAPEFPDGTFLEGERQGDVGDRLADTVFTGVAGQEAPTPDKNDIQPEDSELKRRLDEIAKPFDQMIANTQKLDLPGSADMIQVMEGQKQTELNKAREDYKAEKEKYTPLVTLALTELGRVMSGELNPKEPDEGVTILELTRDEDGFAQKVSDADPITAIPPQVVERLIKTIKDIVGPGLPSLGTEVSSRHGGEPFERERVGTNIKGLSVVVDTIQIGTDKKTKAIRIGARFKKES
jgi:hypothetical protein